MVVPARRLPGRARALHLVAELAEEALLHADAGTRPAAASAARPGSSGPCTSGMGTIGGPLDTDTLTVCPGCTGVVGAGDWATMVPCGWLLSTCVGWMLMWFWPAHAWMVLDVLPDQVGQREPGDHVHGDRLVLRPGGALRRRGARHRADLRVARHADRLGRRRSRSAPPCAAAALACATVSPAGIGGTVIIRGPCEIVSTIVAPGSARPDGDVPITSPFGTLSLITDGPVRTWKPACVQRLRGRPPPSACPPRAPTCTAPRSATSRRRRARPGPGRRPARTPAGC